MVAQWTSDLVGKMHQEKIKKKELANEAGWSYTYTVSVINGKKSPKRAEEKLNSALNMLIEKKKKRCCLTKN